MRRTRVIPCLLLAGGRLVKTVRFGSPRYVGDPINAVRILSERGADELILLDIEASRTGREPDYARLRDIVGEAFMPVAYGGGVTSVEQARRLVSLGVEKVVVNTAALHDLDVVRAISEEIGAASTVVAVDVAADRLVYAAAARRLTGIAMIDHVRAAVAAGAGEILVNDVARDGTGAGYDLPLLREVTRTVAVPLIACGGAGRLEHLREAAEAGASAVAAGSLFVYVGRLQGVMIHYPSAETLIELP